METVKINNMASSTNHFILNLIHLELEDDRMETGDDSSLRMIREAIETTRMLEEEAVLLEMMVVSTQPERRQKVYNAFTNSLTN